MTDTAGLQIERLRRALAAELPAERYEHWIAREPWHLADIAVPLLVGCEPQEWPAFLHRHDLTAAAGALAAALARDFDSVESSSIDVVAIRAWADRRQLPLPQALRALLDFIARTLPARAALPPCTGPAHAVGVGEREQVLGAALALVTRFPERYRDAEGSFDARALAESIVEKSALWFDSGPPSMTVAAIAEVLAAYLDRGSPVQRSLIG